MFSGGRLFPFVIPFLPSAFFELFLPGRRTLSPEKDEADSLDRATHAPHLEASRLST